MMTEHSDTVRTDARGAAPGRMASRLGPLHEAWQGWNRWWFEPTSTVPIALFRALYGALMLAFVALLVPDLQVWFGRGGPFTPADAARFWGNGPDYSVLLWFPAPGAVVVFFAIFTVAAFCLMIGLWTRVSALIVFIGLVSIGHRNPLILHGGDTLLRLMAFYLILAPAGSALSVDRLRALARGTASARPPLAPPWATRLLQLQVAFVYAMTVLLKLKGHAWADGTALYYTSRLEEFHRFPMPFLGDSLLLVNVLTYWTVATELSLAFLVWVPALRRFVLLNGVALHLGIEYSMNVPLFAFAMLISYVTFVDAEAAWQHLLALSPLRNLPRATLWVRTECRTCAATARVLLALDLLGRLTPAATPPPNQPGGLRDVPDGHLCVQTAKGRLYGFDAYRWLAWRLPLLWPVAPLLALPGISTGARLLFDEALRRAHAAAKPARETAEQVLAAVDRTDAGGGRLVHLRDGREQSETMARPVIEVQVEEPEVVRAFLADRCAIKASAMAPADALFDAYTAWARAHSEPVLSQREFGIRLAEQGLMRRRYGKANRWHWAGVALSPLPGEAAVRRTEANRETAGTSERHGMSPVTADRGRVEASPGLAAIQQPGG